MHARGTVRAIPFGAADNGAIRHEDLARSSYRAASTLRPPPRRQHRGHLYHPDSSVALVGRRRRRLRLRDPHQSRARRALRCGGALGGQSAGAGVVQVRGQGGGQEHVRRAGRRTLAHQEEQGQSQDYRKQRHAHRGRQLYRGRAQRLHGPDRHQQDLPERRIDGVIQYADLHRFLSASGQYAVDGRGRDDGRYRHHGQQYVRSVRLRLPRCERSQQLL